MKSHRDSALSALREPWFWLVLLVAAFFAPASHAGTANVTWVNPTQYEDGSSLAAADIASTTVEYGTCSGSAFGTKAGQVVVTGAGTAATVQNLTPGAWCFRAFTTVVAAKGGGVSMASNVASKTVPFPNPRPPTLLDVVIAFIKRLFAHFA